MNDTVSDAAASRPILNGRYEIHRRIARGGMADVFLAKDQLLDRPVAVKVLFPQFAAEQTFVTRFRREAQAAANLNHPNIVAVYDWGEHDNTYFIVMEYVEGQTLADLIAGEGHLAPDRAADIAMEVAGALGFAHRNGTVHRDVKPGNIMINRAGQVKVADFGIARALSGAEDELTQTGSVMGTASYFSPEQAQGRQVDPRSDLYSLGVVLFEMLTGETPFSASSPVAIAYKHVQETPARVMTKNPAVPAPLDQLVERLLRKNPAERYPAADDVKADLRRFREGQPLQGASGAYPAAQDNDLFAATQVRPGQDATIVAPNMSGVTGQVGSYNSIPGAQPGPGNPSGAYPGAHNAGGYPPGGVDATTAMPSNPHGVDTGSRAVIDTSRAVPATAAMRQSEPVEEYYEPPSRTGVFVVMLGLLLAALVVLIMWIATNLSNDDSEAETGAEMLTVPSLIGLTADDARLEVRLLQLEFETVLEENPDVPVNEVFGQDPEAGEDIEVGGVVTVLISRASETETVPNLVGQNVTAAEQQLEALGLTSDKTVQASDEFPENTVIATDPEAGSTVNAGDRVNLTVSVGPDQIQLPSLANLNRETAIATLTNAGFRIPPEFRTEGSSTVAADQVIRTEPEAGQQVSVDSPIIIFVSSGPAQVQVPSLIGLSQEAAQRALQAEELQFVPKFEVDLVPADDPNVGRVTRTNPAAGQVLQQGATVEVFIGEAEAEQPTEPTTPITPTTTEPTTEPTASTTEPDPEPDPGQDPGAGANAGGGDGDE